MVQCQRSIDAITHEVLLKQWFSLYKVKLFIELLIKINPSRKGTSLYQTTSETH